MDGLRDFCDGWRIQIATERLAKEFGRRAFGDNPASYHRARPEYPDWVYDTLISRCGLRRNAAVFEIGAGTGTATHRLLELGADPLVAIEPDQRLADFLRANNPDKALKVVVGGWRRTPVRFPCGMMQKREHAS